MRKNMDELAGGVFARARAGGVGYLGREQRSVKACLSEGLETRPAAQRSFRVRLLPSARVASLVAGFLLVLSLLVVGWQVLASPPAAMPPSIEGQSGELGSALSEGSAGADVSTAGSVRGKGSAGLGESQSHSPKIAPHLYLPGASGSELVVHVAGQVRNPGLVYLFDPSRVADALEAAGGSKDTADLSQLNLARLLTDGEQIYVPSPGETQLPLPGGVGTAGGGGSQSSVVNINTANVSALQSLPGIGPALAQRIVDYRSANGRFTSVDQLDDVSGIGSALLDKLRQLVAV